MSGDKPPKVVDLRGKGRAGWIDALPKPLRIEDGRSEPSVGRSEFADQAMIEISPIHVPMSPATKSAYGSAKLKSRTARRIARTLELSDGVRTNREIGEIIGAEEGQEPFAPKTVGQWRSRGTPKP